MLNNWQFYLLLALALLVIMAFKLTKVLSIIVILSVVIVFIVAYFSKKGGKSDKIRFF
jgi:peptidoglycan/LPS O-acetylase OafA/YrhL